MASATFEIAASGDDGHWSATSTLGNNTANTLVGQTGAGTVNNSFFRFTSVNIPSGSTIDSAVLRVVAFSSSSNAIKTNIYANAVGDAVAPTSVAEAEALALTTAVVAWDDFVQVANEANDSPSLVDVLQEVIDHEDWGTGNALMILVKDDGSAVNVQRGFESFDDLTNTAPQLVVEWTELVGGGEGTLSASTDAQRRAGAFVVIR